MNILIIDGQGGKIGKALTEEFTKAFPSADITAVGTNSAATAAMLKGGAKYGATGENAVKVACKKADIIAGPVGIVIADSLLGEITPAMAEYVGASSAKKILLPVNRCEILIAGVKGKSIQELILDATELAGTVITSQLYCTP